MMVNSSSTYTHEDELGSSLGDAKAPEKFGQKKMKKVTDAEKYPMQVSSH